VAFAKSLPFACKAELLSRIGANGEAASACRHVFALAGSEAERAFFAKLIADHTGLA